MEKTQIEQLDKILKNFELKNEELLNQCRKIIKPYSNNGQYSCNYSGYCITVDELSIDDVKLIVQDYQNEIIKRKNDDNNSNIRQTMIRSNKYGPGNEYGI